MTARRRGEVLAEVSDLKGHKRKLDQRIEEAQEQYDRLRSEYEPKIEDLQERADQLADEFKDLYRRSQEAYKAGDGGRAKRLSQQGKAKQSQCEALNEKANAMRQNLDSKLKSLRTLRNQTQELEDKIDRRVDALDDLRTTEVDGFDQANGLTNLEVEQFLDQFPPVVFNVVESITFKKEGIEEKGGIVAGETFPEAGRYKIEIYNHELAANTSSEELTQEYKRTLSHEVGHVIWGEVMAMAEAEREAWLQRHSKSARRDEWLSQRAAWNVKEDFCETVAMYMLEPNELESSYTERYNAVEELFDELNKLGQ